MGREKVERQWGRGWAEQGGRRPLAPPPSPLGTQLPGFPDFALAVTCVEWHMLPCVSARLVSSRPEVFCSKSLPDPPPHIKLRTQLPCLPVIPPCFPLQPPSPPDILRYRFRLSHLLDQNVSSRRTGTLFGSWWTPQHRGQWLTHLRGGRALRRGMGGLRPARPSLRAARLSTCLTFAMTLNGRFCTEENRGTKRWGNLP